MHDGSILELSEVRYVPSIPKNLISLSILDKSGCKFVGSDGLFKVTFGFSMIMKGRRSKDDSVFYVLGNTNMGFEKASYDSFHFHS